VPDGRAFSANARVVLDESEEIIVNLDLSVRAESIRMGEDGVSTVASKAGAGRLIEEPYLSMLDWLTIHLDLLEHKEAKGLRNLIIPPGVPRRIIEKRDPAAYNLVADGSLFEPRASLASRSCKKQCRPSCASTSRNSTTCASSGGTPRTWYSRP
jgi:hypothetical protein